MYGWMCSPKIHVLKQTETFCCDTDWEGWRREWGVGRRAGNAWKRSYGKWFFSSALIAALLSYATVTLSTGIGRFFIFGGEIIGFGCLTVAARFSIISSIGHIENRGRAGTGRFQRKLLGIMSFKIERQSAHRRNAIARCLFNSKGATRSQGCDRAVPARMNSDQWSLLYSQFIQESVILSEQHSSLQPWSHPTCSSSSLICLPFFF